MGEKWAGRRGVAFLLVLLCSSPVLFANPCSGAIADWCKELSGGDYVITVNAQIDPSEGPITTTLMKGNPGHPVATFQSSSSSHTVSFVVPVNAQAVSVTVSGTNCGPTTPATTSTRPASQIPDCL